MQVVWKFGNQMTKELAEGAPPPPMLPVAVLGAVELMILDKTASLYIRCFAFYKLLEPELDHFEQLLAIGGMLDRAKGKIFATFH